VSCSCLIPCDSASTAARTSSLLIVVSMWVMGPGWLHVKVPYFSVLWSFEVCAGVRVTSVYLPCVSLHLYSLLRVLVAVSIHCILLRSVSANTFLKQNKFATKITKQQ
jgi:hypothetical protein